MDSVDVIVLGGTGFLGRRVVQKLLEHGRSVGIAARSPGQATAPTGDPEHPVRLFEVDVRDSDSLIRALKNAHAVINCVGLYVETRRDSFYDVHVRGARNLAEIAVAEGVRRLVHISGIGVDSSSPSAYIRARAEGENQVRSIFPEATILRPSALFSTDGAFFGALDALVHRLPVVPLFGDGSTRLQPVAVDDVAEAACRALDSDYAPGTVFELGGPEVFTYRDILERLAARAGRQCRFVPLPFAIWQTLAVLASILPRPPLTLAQVALMRQDNVVGEDFATFRDLQIVPRSATRMGIV